MKQPDVSPQHEWMDERVEAYVDGVLPDDEIERFEAVLQEEAHWEEQVQQASRIQESLHDMRTPPAPPALTQRILQQTSRGHRPMPWWKRTLQQMIHSWRALGAARRHPVFDYAVGIAFVAMAVFFIAMPLGREAQPPAQISSQFETTAPYSAEEIRHAAESAQWTLTSLSELGAETTRSLRNQVYRVVGSPSADTVSESAAEATASPTEHGDSTGTDPLPMP